MATYPQWVEACRRKGTVILKNGDDYFLYSTVSHRVPGKNNPQVERKYLGKITKGGLVLKVEVNVDQSNIKVYEYGFSYALLALIPKQTISRECDREELVKAIALFESPSSYLLLESEDCKETGEEKGVSYFKERFFSLTGVQVEILAPLKQIYLLIIDGTRILSAIDTEQHALLQKLGVTLRCPTS